jgi:ribulose-phosphate 3-epimerase
VSVQIAPSILSAASPPLASGCRVERRRHLIHVDVMDGHFVPNITIQVPVVRSLKRFAACRSMHR